jgi:RHS repeat-associated protein
VRFISDSSGNVVSEYVYDVWGNLVSSSGSVSQPYEYVGREGYYREGELYLLGQRWYDSSVGRFISRDPIREVGGTNIYLYTNNNPLAFIDPIGQIKIILDSWWIAKFVWDAGIIPDSACCSGLRYIHKAIAYKCLFIIVINSFKQYPVFPPNPQREEFFYYGNCVPLNYKICC